MSGSAMVDAPPPSRATGVEPASATPEVRTARLLAAVAVGALLWALPVPEGLEATGWHLLAIFVASLVAIVGRALPMGAVAVVAIATIVFTHTLELEEVLSGFASDTVWLVVSAFILAGVFIRTGLGPRIAYLFMSAFGQRTLGLAYSLAATDLVLAPFIPSHTARAGGVLFPIVKSLATTAFGREGTEDERRSAGFLVMAVYQSSIVGSGMFLTGMVANPVAAAFAAEQGIEISWTLWALAALVPGIVSILLAPLLVYLLHRPPVRRTPDATALARRELAALGPMQRGERILLVVFALLLGAWVFGSRFGIAPTSAIFGALAVLLLTRVLRWEDVAREHEAWNTFVWFATLLMMASALGRHGVTGWFAGSVTAAVGDVGWVTGFLTVSLVYFYSHYFFASNTAHVSAMYAPFLAISLALGTPPLLAALTLAYFSNLFAGLTHYAAATAPVFFAGGYVPLGTWWRVGGLISVANVTIFLLIGGTWWKVLGLW